MERTLKAISIGYKDEITVSIPVSSGVITVGDNGYGVIVYILESDNLNKCDITFYSLKLGDKFPVIHKKTNYLGIVGEPNHIRHIFFSAPHPGIHSYLISTDRF